MHIQWCVDNHCGVKELQDKVDNGDISQIRILANIDKGLQNEKRLYGASW